MKQSKKRTIGVFALGMINVAAICSLRNFPLTAEYGFTALFLWGISALIFFIPVSFISAELASGWPERGVYRWVTEAMGLKMGFLAIWLQWAENIIWYPTILSFIGATFAYIFNPELATNQTYIFSIVLLSIWSLTLVNLLGMKISSWISALSSTFGTVLPGFLIIFLGILWILKGHPSYISFGMKELVPDLTSARELAILAGVMLSFAGMEMSAVHAKEVHNPQKNYPKAILFSAFLIFILYTFGSLAISAVVPKGEVDFASGGIQAFQAFLDAFSLGWLVPFIAFIMVGGGLGTVSTWLVGPTRGVLASALDGDLPPVFQKTNKKGMPVSLLIFQAIIVTLLSTVFLFMPDINSSYWILVDLAALLYLIMYIMMFATGIILRYKCPKVKRAYKIPYKNVGMWLIASIGILGSLFTAIMAFFPPAQLDAEKLVFFEGFLILGILFFCGLPLLIYHFKKPSWKKR